MDNNIKEELYHHGILGQKWGVRRYQKSNGRLTLLGKIKEKKLRKQESKLKAKEDNLKVERLMLNNDYKKVTGKDLIDSSFNKLKIQKSIKDMSDSELDKEIARLQKESNLKRLRNENKSKGKKLLDSVLENVVSPAFQNSGRTLLERGLTKLGDQHIIDNLGNKTKTEFQLLKEKSERLKVEADIMKNEDTINKLTSNREQAAIKKKKEENEKQLQVLRDKASDLIDERLNKLYKGKTK